MTSQSPLTADGLCAGLLEAARTDKRVLKRSLMPVLDDLVKQGTPHEVLLRVLAEGGLPMSQDAFRKALYRWRLRTKKAPDSQVASPQRLQTAPPATRLSPRVPSAITSKADLVQLRKSQDPIDLNQLAEMGRRK
ncbi:hypothetical protein [Achromobacter insuavis]|uniref:hypothetical protein n=1 Tax=Achromobacter insuavis TaxID=1287735 RepID=UPI0013C310A5|nr:hypothetical protein [Achromobacter insuavis]